MYYAYYVGTCRLWNLCIRSDEKYVENIDIVKMKMIVRMFLWSFVKIEFHLLW